MVYCISDVHGQRAALEQLLSHINLKLDDRLYLLGDYVDRGPDSIGTLLLIGELLGQPNVTILQGNHDAMFYRTLYDIKYSKHTYFPWERLYSGVWKSNGGDETLRQYNKLTRTERDKIYSILSKLTEAVQKSRLHKAIRRFVCVTLFPKLLY
jgi:serine/threonine protein phosphatase 1